MHLPTGNCRCREERDSFNVEGGKLEWNENDHHSALFQLPFVPTGIFLFFCHHLEKLSLPSLLLEQQRFW